MWYNKDKLTEMLIAIKKQKKFNSNDKLGASIGVSGSHISYVINQQKGLSPDKLKLFCEVHNIDPEELRGDTEEEVARIGNIVSKRMEEKNLNLSIMSKKTGIPIFDLFNILSNTTKPTKEQVELLAKALETPTKALLENRYMNNFLKIRHCLDDMGLKDGAIDAVISFIEQQI